MIQIIIKNYNNKGKDREPFLRPPHLLQELNNIITLLQDIDDKYSESTHLIQSH